MGLSPLDALILNCFLLKKTIQCVAHALKYVEKTRFMYYHLNELVLMHIKLLFVMTEPDLVN